MINDYKKQMCHISFFDLQFCSSNMLIIITIIKRVTYLCSRFTSPFIRISNVLHFLTYLTLYIQVMNVYWVLLFGC
jgi:hypothetical protein